MVSETKTCTLGVVCVELTCEDNNIWDFVVGELQTSSCLDVDKRHWEVWHSNHRGIATLESLDGVESPHLRITPLLQDY